jgi:hypothetical protein
MAKKLSNAEETRLPRLERLYPNKIIKEPKVKEPATPKAYKNQVLRKPQLFDTAKTIYFCIPYSKFTVSR